MEKTRQQLVSNLKRSDLIIEVIDARAPFSSINPIITQLLNKKKHLVIISKIDMCDQKQFKLWSNYLKEEKINFLTLDLVNKFDFKKINQKINQISLESKLKWRKNDLLFNVNPPINAMIVGVPNVGKSTLINKLIKKKTQKVGDLPGVTKIGVWVKVNDNLFLYDSPGILWPNINNHVVSRNLSIINSIKNSDVNLQYLFFETVIFLKKYYSNSTNKIFNIINNATTQSILDDMWEFYFKGQKKPSNFEKNVVDKFFNDLRKGKLGKFTFDIFSEFKK